MDAPEKEPALRHKDRGQVSEVEVHRDLFVGPVKAVDVEQGTLGDCFFIAALTSFAQRRPDDVRKAISSNADGTYSVRFFRREPETTTFTSVVVHLDDVLPEHSKKPIYATVVNGRGLWVSLFEKAFAIHRGGYDVLDRGGDAGVVIEELTGRLAHTTWLEREPPDAVWKILQDAIAADQLTLASTYTNDQERALLARRRAHGKPIGDHDPATFSFHDCGIVPAHDYTVWGVSDAEGRRTVMIRNPWAHFEPAGNGKDDGMFSLPFDEFVILFANVTVGG